MLTDEEFAEVRYQWIGDLERTNYFEKPDPSMPPVHVALVCSDATMGKLIRTVSRMSGLTENMLTGDLRRKDIVGWRFIIIRAAYRMLGMPSARIGRSLGKRDHSTILNGLRRSDDLMKNPEWFQRYQELANAL